MNFSGKLYFAFLISCWLVLNLGGGIVVKYTGIYHQNLIMLGVLFVLLFATFGGRAIVSMLIGKMYQLSYAYPFLGLNYVLSLFAGWILFHEKITFPRLIGSLVILAGVCLLMLSKNKVDAEKA